MFEDLSANLLALFVTMGFLMRAFIWRSNWKEQLVGRYEDNLKNKQHIDTLRNIIRSMEIEYTNDFSLKARKFKLMAEEEITENELLGYIVKYCQHTGFPSNMFTGDDWPDFRNWYFTETTKESLPCE